MPPGFLEHAPEFFLRESGSALKVHILNFYFRSFFDVENNGRAARLFINFWDISDFRLRVASLLVHLFDFLAVGENLSLVVRFANLLSQLFAELGGTVFLVPYEGDV